MSNNEKILKKIKEIITQKDERPKVVSEQITFLLKQIPELVKYINENDLVLKNDIFYDLGRYIKYHKFLKGDIIQRIYEGDKFFYMIVTGEVVKIGIKYKKVTTTLKEYILYLTKLQLLEEYFLLNDCIEKNQEIFPFKSEKNMIKIFQKLQGFNFKNEFKIIKSEINNSKWMNNPNNIEEFFDLINPSFINGKKSFLSKDMKFPVILPHYVKDEILGPNSFLGNLLKIKGIKEFSSYICINNADILYIDKSTIPQGCKLMNIFDNRLNYSVIDNIIKKNIIFKNTNFDFLIKYYSKYFKLVNISKGQMLIGQGRPHEGIYFINKGVFQLKTEKSYYELQELIFSLRDSLDNFSNYISDIKKREEDDLNSGGKNIQKKLSLYKHPLFLIKCSEKKEIAISSFHAPQIIGLNELYESKTGIYHFSIYCISEESEIYFLPNEFVNSLLSNNYIYNSIAGLIEERVKFLLFTIKKYKNRFEEEFENFISKPKASIINNLNYITLSPISKKLFKKRKLKINGTQFIENSNNEIILNDNYDKKNVNESSNNINKNLFSFDSFSTKKKKKLILDFKDQEKNSNVVNEIKLNNNNFLSSITHKTKNILSDSNKSLEKSETLNFSSENNIIGKLNKRIILSPSNLDIKKDINKLLNKNDSIINNNRNNYNLLNKNGFVTRKMNLKQTNYKLLPLNPSFKSYTNILNLKENNFFMQLKKLYFNKRHDNNQNEEINNEKENKFFNKINIKRKFNLRTDYVNNSYNMNNINLNQNKKKFSNLIESNIMKDINKNRINSRRIKPLNNIKSNSCNFFKLDKINQFGNSLLL